MGIGDAIFIDSALARRAQLKDLRKVRIMHCKKIPWLPVWENNPRIARPADKGDFQIVYGRDPVTNMRPYHLAKTPERWTYNLEFRPEPGEIYFSKAERKFGARYPGRLILEPNIKASGSPNKAWGTDRWQRLANLFIDAGMPVAQLGPSGTVWLDGAERIITENFRLAAAVVANARYAVLPEGGTHHAAAALNVRAVVIMGGFTPVELTGYAMHKNIGVSLGDACGMRIPCLHCAAEMAKITPGQIFDELRRM